MRKKIGLNKKWNFLKEGDTIDIIAPGFLSTSKEIQLAVEFIKSWNLVPQVFEHVSGDHFLHSNTDVARFKDFKKALYHSKSKVIWCLRGGYGSLRLLPYLQKIKKPPQQVKLLIGISDISSLHLYLNQKWKWPSLHASLLDRLGQGKVPLNIQNQLKELLFGKIQKVEMGGLTPMNTKAKKVKTLSGSIIGGNLTVLQSSLGTPFQMNLKNKFLFIEDLGERGYRVDRMLEHFRQAEVFKGCLGILVGEFQGGNEPQTESSKVHQVLERFAAENIIPVWIGVPAGHGENQWPLFFQTEVKIRTQNPKSSSSTFSLEIQSFGESQKK